jgi:hypothetical protein
MSGESNPGALLKYFVNVNAALKFPPFPGALAPVQVRVGSQLRHSEVTQE